MRHNKKVNHLGRQSAHRKAMLSNMASSLIMHKRINTTIAKAKALRTFVEPLITKSKEDTTHQRRIVFSQLKSKEAVTELFRNVAPKIGDRPGGYTRILKTGFRLGDAADMCLIELVDFNETYVAGAVVAKAKTRRSRSGSKPAEGAQVEGEAGEAAAKPAAKKAAPAAKKAAPAPKKAAPVKTSAPKTGGSKKAVTKGTATKKG